MPFENKKGISKKETELIKACQRHETLAQSEFFRLYSAKFLGVAYRFAGDYDIANDLLQEGFIKIFNNIQNYQFKGSFEGWMRRIMVNTAINYLKKHYRMYNESVEISEIETLAQLPNILEEMNCEEIINEINLLPAGFRAIINLYAIEGYTYPEIAALLEIKEVTVRTQYLRAKQKLAIALDKKKITYATKII